MSSVSSEKEFGKEIGLIKEVIITGRKVGAGKDFWSTLAHDKEKFREVVQFVNARSTFDVVVDYSRTLADMIKANSFSAFERGITAKHFPVKGEGRKELTITLFYFNRFMESEEIVAEMKREGFRPGKIEELLALSEKYPDLQKKFPIVALDSVWHPLLGPRLVPVLVRFGIRRLELYRLENGWDTDWRFAALREAS